MIKNLFISMYHYTRDLKKSKYPEIKGLDKKLFVEQLEFFRNSFNVVTMKQVINAFEGKEVLPEKALLLTFDDGYIDNYEVAMPLLKEYGIEGSFFIPAKTFKENKLLDVNKIHFILASSFDRKDEIVNDLNALLDKYRTNDYATNQELYREYAVANRFDDKDTIYVKRVLQTAIPENKRNIIASELFAKYVGIPEDEFARSLYMNKEQIRSMKENGMFIGIHGYDHYWLGDLAEEDMKNDIDKSLEAMKEFIDFDNWVMNYPYGSYNENVIEYIKTRGCKLALTTDVRIVDINKDNRFKLPRLDCNDFPPKSENYLKYNND